MSYQEKRTLVSALTTLIIILSYYIYIFNIYNDEFYSSTVDFSFWGMIILVLLPLLILGQIIVHILFHIIIAVFSSEKEDPTLEDERDKLIDLKATRNFYHVFITGFFLAIASVAFGFSPVVMFNIFLASIFLAGIIGGISQFFYYKRGF